MARDLARLKPACAHARAVQLNTQIGANPEEWRALHTLVVAVHLGTECLPVGRTRARMVA